jgi:membrane protease YdiL (CAAX protease family)
MAPHASQPWNPDRAWADPFIALLCLAALALGSMQWHAARAQQTAPAARVSLVGEAQDAALGGTKALEGLHLRTPRGSRPPAPADAASRPGWDQALLAVHLGEAGDLDGAERLGQAAPGPLGQHFRQAFAYAYRGTGSAPSAADRAELRDALGAGYAARILEARLVARAGGRPEALETAARDWALSRLALLAAAGLGAVLLGGAGVVFGLLQAQRGPSSAPLPRYGLSGRALVIVLLGWFLTFLASGSAIALLLRALPWLRPLQLPLVYSLHAGLGVFYLCRAEGISFVQLRNRVAPAPRGRALAMGLGYYAVAFAAVFTVAWLLSPFLGRAASPQQRLFDLLAGLKGTLPLVLLFATVAGLAPAFEELLFRGCLLPWLAERLARPFPRRARFLAAALTAIGFAAMHLQPLGLPTLATLGLVLGFAYLRTGNLSTSFLVHALWNGGVFLLVRAL